MDIVWENIIPYFTQPSQSQRDSRRSLTREENIEIQTEHKDIKSQPVAQLTVLEIPYLRTGVQKYRRLLQEAEILYLVSSKRWK